MEELIRISRLIKKKAIKDDLSLLVNFAKKEDVIFPIKKELKEKWNLSKTQTLFTIYIFPLILAISSLLAKLKGYPSKIEFINAIFRRENEKIEMKIEELADEGEKKFYILFKELNNIGIEQGECYREIGQKQDHALKCKKVLIKNPTLPAFEEFMNSMEDLCLVKERLTNIILRKIEKQKEFINQFNSLPHLDDRDSKDLKRALLTDFAFSYVGSKVIFVATPIEVLLKSDKLADKASIDILGWSGRFLYTGIVLIKNRQKDYSSWLNNLLRSIESRQ